MGVEFDVLNTQSINGDESVVSSEQKFIFVNLPLFVLNLMFLVTLLISLVSWRWIWKLSRRKFSEESLRKFSEEIRRKFRAEKTLE